MTDVVPAGFAVEGSSLSTSSVYGRDCGEVSRVRKTRSNVLIGWCGNAIDRVLCNRRAIHWPVSYLISASTHLAAWRPHNVSISPILPGMRSTITAAYVARIGTTQDKTTCPSQ